MKALLSKFLNKKAFAARRATRQFTFGKRKYHYFSHQYNWTWLNERTVEIPLIWDLLQDYQQRGKKILEVGNVLAHYFKIGHSVVDKYEQAPGVINQDILDYKSQEKFDLIVAISTFEHIGWDEAKKDEQKILKAIAHCRKLLKKNGKMMISFPLGHNLYLDELIYQEKLPLKIKFLQRLNLVNDWREISFEGVKKLRPKYGQPFENANVIGVGELEN